MKKICKFDSNINNILNTSIPESCDIYVTLPGLKSHIEKHQGCEKYVDDLDNIIKTADYIGRSDKQAPNSFELVKLLDNNVLVAIKFNEKNGFLYVASIYDITSSKLNNRLRSGRLKSYEHVSK